MNLGSEIGPRFSAAFSHEGAQWRHLVPPGSSVNFARWMLVSAVLPAAMLAVSCADKGPNEATPTPQATGTQPAASATASVPPGTRPATKTATSAPAPTATSTPAPIPGGQVFEHGDRGSDMIALTFDMGGRVDPALDIMNWLVANEVRATIFMTGSMAANQNTEAGREVLRIVEDHPDLFVLGNHSYSHPDFRELDAAGMASELERTEQAIAQTTDVSARPFFRPPFGGVDASVVSGVAAAGYDRTVMWDIDTIDWRPEEDGGPTAADMVAKVTTNAQGGSIVLMHLGGYNTFDALPEMVANLRAKGLEPVTLAEMLP
jgi:peptidoglycan/xylan/chitin deacetylase (PgdA/CDA1 family)